MFNWKNERLLRKWFRRSGEQKPRPGHKDELLSDLMIKYDQMYKQKEKIGMRWTIFRKGIVLAFVGALFLGGACAAPADVEVDVGKSLDISLPLNSEGIDPKAVAQAVEKVAASEGIVKSVRVKALRQNDQMVIHFDLWGDGFSKAPLADKLRKEVPALEKVEIREETVLSEVRGNWGEKIGQELLHVNMLDEAEVEQARQKVMERLAAEGVKGKIDVKIEGDANRQEIEVRIENPDCDPPTTESAGQGEAAPQK